MVLQTIDHTKTQERHKALNEEVKRMITDSADKPVHKLCLIDEVQRLGVVSIFEKKKIEDAVQKLCQAILTVIAMISTPFLFILDCLSSKESRFHLANSLT